MRGDEMEDVFLEFSEEELRRVGRDFEGTLVVKLIGGRSFNKQIFSTLFKHIWGQKGEVHFREVDENVMVVRFGDVSDRERVMNSGPWTFMGWTVLVDRWAAGRALEDLFSHKVPMVVQVHNLPLEMRTEEIARRCAAVASRVVEPVNPTTTMELKKFYKFKVEIDAKKPLETGCFLGKRENNPPPPPSALFRYENLPNICFNCGFLDHETTQCMNPARRVSIAYGRQIRAEVNIEEKISEPASTKLGESSKEGAGAQDGVLDLSSNSEESWPMNRLPEKLKSITGCAELSLGEETPEMSMSRNYVKLMQQPFPLPNAKGMGIQLQSVGPGESASPINSNAEENKRINLGKPKSQYLKKKRKLSQMGDTLRLAAEQGDLVEVRVLSQGNKNGQDEIKQ